MIFNIPLLMVLAFLLLTLGVGIYFSGKTTTLRSYAVGNKQFATATLVATMLATAYGGGGLVRTVEQVHKSGLYWIIIFLSSSVAIWALSLLAVRMGPFMEHLSMPETIGSVYGRYPRIITALSSIGCYIATLAIQINVLVLSLSICLPSVDSQCMAIVAACILIFHSTSGGIRAVTWTDVLQFLTFSVIIPLFAWMMLKNTGRPIKEIISFLRIKKTFRFNSIFRLDKKFIATLALLSSNIVSYITPSYIQRIYMSSGPIQARAVFTYASCFSALIGICVLAVGIFVFVRVPDLPTAGVWPYIMVQLPPVFKGCIAISLLAITMSTADSSLNTCSVMVSQDILGSLDRKGSISFFTPLRLARLSSVFIGLLAMIFAFYRKDLLDLLKLGFDFSIPIFTAPFLLAVFGFRGSSRTALLGMAAGIIAILVWNKWVEPSTDIDGSFVCMLANGLTMLAAHYLWPQPEDKGWVGAG